MSMCQCHGVWSALPAKQASKQQTLYKISKHSHEEQGHFAVPVCWSKTRRKVEHCYRNLDSSCCATMDY